MCDAQLVSEAPVEGQTLLVEGHPAVELPEDVDDAAVVAQRVGTKALIQVAGAGEQAPRTTGRLRTEPRRPRSAQARRPVAARARSRDCRRPIGARRGGSPAPAGRFPEHLDRRRRLPSFADCATARKCSACLRPDLAVLAGFAQSFRRELVDRLEHPEAAARPAADEALVDQRLQLVEVGVADRQRRVKVEAAREDRRASGRRAVHPRRGARSSTRSSREAFAAAPGHPARRRSGAEARARGARARSSADSTETRAAASSSASGSPSRRRQISPTAGLAENPGSTARARSRKSVIASSSGSGSTGNRCSPARLSGSRLVASSFTPLVSRSSSARSGAASRTCSRLSSSSRAVRPRRNSATPSLAPDVLRDRRLDEPRIGDGLEGNPEDTTLEVLDCLGGELERETRLPRAAWADERDESVPAQKRAGLRELAVPADERRRLQRADSSGEAS